MPNPRDPGQPLSAENRAMFRQTIPPEMWQQMAQYGMGQSNQWPDWRGIQGVSGGELPLLEALIMGLKKEQEARRSGGIQEKSITLQPGDENLQGGTAGQGYIK